MYDDIGGHENEKNQKKIRKKLGTIAVVVSMTVTMSMNAFAAETGKTSVNEVDEKVYTWTVELNAIPYTVQEEKTVTSGQSLSLALEAGASGWSNPVTTFRFSTLPTNAIVKSIKIEPGTGVSNNGMLLFMEPI